MREALEFSALLRQPYSTPRAEKLKYVDVILDLLEMRDIEDCLVGSPGNPGLTIEQRKRLTIGVELVAKPSVLIFLDEPVSNISYTLLDTLLTGNYRLPVSMVKRLSIPCDS